MISSRLKDYLDGAGVRYERHSHRSAYTSQQIAQSVHVSGNEMVKAVILKTDRGQLVMAVLSSNDAANLDTLRQEIGSGELRLASESEFADAFPTCDLGAMPPFGNLFDVPVWCEAALADNKEIEFNAGAHDETIRMRFEDYEKLVQPNMTHFAQPYREGLQRIAA